MDHAGRIPLSLYGASGRHIRVRRRVTDVSDGDGNRIEVWYLIGTLAVGGTEKTLVDLVTGLDREQFAPTIWTIGDPGPLAEEVPNNVPIHSLGATSKADVRAPLRFVWALHRERPDVLQSFLFFDNTVARLAGVFSPETMVITGVREVPESMPWHRDVVDRTLLPLSDLVVSNSEAGADWIVERGASPDAVEVVHNGRRIQKYSVDDPASDSMLSLPGDGPVVGTVGRLVELKGHHDLLEAWPSVRDEFPDAQLVIVGDGPERDALEEHADRIGVSNSVHLLGRRDDVPNLLAQFDTFVLPSHHEGLSGALLEAMCAGLPIVATSVPGNAELLDDERHGLLVPSRSPERLSDALLRIITDDALAHQLSSNAKARAESAFSVDSMVGAFEALYGDV